MKVYRKGLDKWDLTPIIRQTDRQTDKQTDSQTDRHGIMIICG